MSTQALLERQIHEVRRQLQLANLDDLARQTGFRVRSPRKIPLLKMVLALVALAAETSLSLERVAAVIALAAGTTYSKQAFHQRLGAKLECFLFGLAAELFHQLGQPLQNQGAFQSFGRVLLHDSTVEALPEHLAKSFPGSANQRTQRLGAALKLQFVCDLLRAEVLHVGISGFRRNDQASASDILELLRPNDLVIRDLGYFVLDVFKQIDDKGAFFLSRYRHDVLVSDPATQKPLNLAKELRHGRLFDRQILLGRDRMPVRLVALPVPEALANERRRRAKTNRDQRLNPSKATLYLLGWNIFVTNVPRKIWPPKLLLTVYRLRWRIEVVFKAWKSHLGLRHLNCRSLDMLRLSLLVKLLFCFAAYRWCDQLELLGDGRHHVSLLRLARILGQCACWFALTLVGVSMARWLEWHVSQHLFYETRPDRKNYYELLNEYHPRLT
jgi:hypothetical protein